MKTVELDILNNTEIFNDDSFIHQEDNNNSYSYLFIHNNEVLKIYIDKFEVVKNNIKVLKQISKTKELKNIKELVLPNYLVSYKNQVVGYSMRNIKGQTLDEIIKNDIYDVNTIKNIFKKILETIEKINNQKLNISIGDLHEKNIIIDDRLNLHFIDIDSYKVENIEFGSKYLYKLENTNQSVNTDRYCLMIMILNYLMNNKNTLFTDLNEYEKDNYLKKFSKKEIKLINQLNYKKEFKLSSKDIDLLFKNHNNKRYIKEESICDISDKELQSLIQNIKQRVRSI